MKRILETAAGIVLAVGILIAIGTGSTYVKNWTAGLAMQQEAIRQRLAQEKRDAANEACRNTYAQCIHTAAADKRALTACGKASLACHEWAGPSVYGN
jgi:uncharacterized membrane protein